MLSEYSMTTKQMEEYSMVKFNTDLPSYKIRAYLWDEMKQTVNYDKYTYCYSLKSGVNKAELTIRIQSKFEKKAKAKENFRKRTTSTNSTKEVDGIEKLYSFSSSCVFKALQSNLKRFLKSKYL